MNLRLASPCPWPQGYSSSSVQGWMPGEVRPVSAEVGGYLLSTFPEWFAEAKGEGSEEAEGSEAEPAEEAAPPAPKRPRKGA